MIYLKLFLSFLKIGATSFGGGYGMIALMRDVALAEGWMTEAELLNFIAVAESTPGPIAVNMATFVGTSMGGVLGAFLATLGVVLPSFVVILVIAALIRNLLKLSIVRAALGGIRPVIVGLILATGCSMLLSTLCGFSAWGDPFLPDWRALLILGLLTATSLLLGRVRKKPTSPILFVLIAGVLGVLLYL